MIIQIIKCGALIFEEFTVDVLLASVVMLNDGVDFIGWQYPSSARRWLCDSDITTTTNYRIKLSTAERQLRR